MQIETILFDLDDTLYPGSSGIWSLIRERIDRFMVEKLNYKEQDVPSTREKLFGEFGTTLRGLESVHHIDPVDYLRFVHDIPINDFLVPNPKLNELLEMLPQQKVIFTNGDRWHAKRVTDALNITRYFERTVDIIDVTPYCKPMVEAFRLALQKLNITDPTKILLVDDNIRNIEAANNLGLKSVLVSEDGQRLDPKILQIRKIEDLESVFPFLPIKVS